MSQRPEVKLGSFIGEDVQRDAIHIAVAPVTSDETLFPGQRIGIVDAADPARVRHTGVEHIGIVDPFLDCKIPPGTSFWMCLFPYTITSLRHDWSHPAFLPTLEQVSRTEPSPQALERARSEQWMREFASSARLDYQVVLDAARQYVAGGDQYCQYDDESARDAMFGHAEEFWRHYEVITGEQVKEKNGVPFTCSC